jgi:DNA-binding CsgD family transcriptional regulator
MSRGFRPIDVRQKAIVAAPHDVKDGGGASVEPVPVALSIAAVISEKGESVPGDGEDPLSRVTWLSASQRESVLDMRSHRRELQQRSGELRAHRRALGQACAELKELLPNEGRQPTAPVLPSRLVPANGILEMLSPQQRRVLEGVLAGRANKEIAFDLGVSTKTVETHRARLMVKLEVESLVELVRLCTIAGIR